MLQVHMAISSYTIKELFNLLKAQWLLTCITYCRVVELHFFYHALYMFHVIVNTDDFAKPAGIYNGHRECSVRGTNLVFYVLYPILVNDSLQKGFHLLFCRLVTCYVLKY